MRNIIGLINYGIAGNIHSIKKAIEKAGGSVKIVNTKEELFSVDKIVIPGVGSFVDAMKELENDDLLDTLKDVIDQEILDEINKLLSPGMEVMEIYYTQRYIQHNF